jgi:phenylalanyl-tRNA synthetase beta chain
VDAWELRVASRVIIAELALEGLSGGRLEPETVPAIARVPAVERDLAIVVGESTAAAQIEAVIREHGGELLRDARLFDIYRGAPLAAGEKSLAFRVVFQAADRTLTEDEVDGSVTSITTAVGNLFGGRIRS